MTKILVTGAAGFIGSHTVDMLLAAGHTVVGVDNLRTGRCENLDWASSSSDFVFHKLDVTENKDFGDLVGRERPDALVHLAALVSVQESIVDPSLNFRLNVEGTQAVIEAARVAVVPRVVFASSAAVYGDSEVVPLDEDAPKRPITPYGAAKLASEELLLGAARTYGFTAICLRYFNVFGPRQLPGSPYSGVVSKFVDCCKTKSIPVVFGDGQQTRDFVHVRDVARANAIAALRPGLPMGAYNLANGGETSLRQILDVLTSLEPTMPSPDFREARAGDIRRSVGDPTRWRTVSRFAPQESISTGLAELVRPDSGKPKPAFNQPGNVR